MTNRLSVKTRILNALLNNQQFSVAQAQHRFGAVNIAARVNELRDEGYSIYTNTKSRWDGSTFKSYRLGTPSNQVRAAARRAVMTGRKAR